MTLEDFAHGDRLKVLLERYRNPPAERPREARVVPLLVAYADCELFDRVTEILEREWETSDLGEIIVRAVVEAAERT